MKSFNLEQAKAGYPVCTRDGRPVRIICYDRLSEHYPIVGLVKSGYDNPEEIIHIFTNDGNASIIGPTDIDLFMDSAKKEGWINIYQCDVDKIEREGRGIYGSEEEALKSRMEENYITTIKIEWEE